MNQSSRPFRFIGALALLTFVIGCATTGTQTQDLLVAAGFKPYPADTPEKQELLKSLPTGQLSLIKWKGKSLYVQPDVPNNRAFAGTPEHYEKYRELRFAQRMSNDQLLADQMQRDAMMRWDVWGPGMYGGLYGGLYGRRF
jgi:hypothetical protein